MTVLSGGVEKLHEKHKFSLVQSCFKTNEKGHKVSSQG